MKILFLSLIDFESLEEHNIYTDLLREFVKKGHSVYAVSPVEKRKGKETYLISKPEEIILKVKIGNIQKTNVIEKGISTITIESKMISAIKKYFADVKFDLVLYTTPPITLQKAVNYVKKRDNAVTYLMLKDIFPQNAVDIGMLSKNGVKGILYNYFRNKEKKLYRDSDYIGCMSQANVEYVLKHNPELPRERVEECPNCMEPTNRTITDVQKQEIRQKLGIPNDRIMFVYGGNLGRPQAIPFLIDCLREVKDNEKVFFVIVGNGTEYVRLENYVREEVPKNVKLMQVLPKEEYENMILAADVGMIFLDYRFTIPNFPSRILSYMDAGLPVLSVTDSVTDIGKLVETEEFGVAIKGNDVKAFAKAVEKFNDVDIAQMGENARKCLNEKYTVQVGYNVIMEHLEA